MKTKKPRKPLRKPLPLYIREAEHLEVKFIDYYGDSVFIRSTGPLGLKSLFKL